MVTLRRPRKILFGIGVVLMLLIGVALALRTPDSDVTAMVEKYGGEPSRFLELPVGQHIHVRDTGGDEGQPVLVLLHGTFSSLWTWEPLASRLKTRYRVITLDLPGHGLTGQTRSGRYDVETMIETVRQTTDALGVRHFVLGGNSLGGRVAWRYALAHPEQVQALLLLDASGMPPRADDPPQNLPIGFRLAADPIGRLFIRNYTPRSMVRRSIEESVAYPQIVDEVMVDRYWELMRFPGNRAAMAERMASVPAVDPYAGQVRRIAVPTLILFGKKDRLVNPSAARTFHERIPQSEVVLLDNVGHLPMEELPDATAAVIRDFLGRHRIGPAGSQPDPVRN